jgi:hypothetical protein
MTVNRRGSGRAISPLLAAALALLVAGLAQTSPLGALAGFVLPAWAAARLLPLASHIAAREHARVRRDCRILTAWVLVAVAAGTVHLVVTGATSTFLSPLAVLALDALVALLAGVVWSRGSQPRHGRAHRLYLHLCAVVFGALCVSLAASPAWLPTLALHVTCTLVLAGASVLRLTEERSR